MGESLQIPKILVLGIGNELLRDEGLGIHAVRLLQTHELPPQVEVLEGGTAGPQLLTYLEGIDRLFVIDCIDAKAAPGSIFRFQPGDLGTFPKDYAASIHDVGLLEVLQIVDFLGHELQTEVFAMQPAVIEWGMDLTPEIQNRLPHLVNLIYSEICHSL